MKLYCRIYKRVQTGRGIKNINRRAGKQGSQRRVTTRRSYKTHDKMTTKTYGELNIDMDSVFKHIQLNRSFATRQRFLSGPARRPLCRQPRGT